MILEGEAITPAVLGADFLSPLAGGGAGGATLCNYKHMRLGILLYIQ